MRPLTHPNRIFVLLACVALAAVYQLAHFRKDSARDRIAAVAMLASVACELVNLTLWRSFALSAVATAAIVIAVFLPPWAGPTDRTPG